MQEIFTEILCISRENIPEMFCAARYAAASFRGYAEVCRAIRSSGIAGAEVRRLQKRSKVSSIRSDYMFFSLLTDTMILTETGVQPERKIYNAARSKVFIIQ